MVAQQIWIERHWTGGSIDSGMERIYGGRWRVDLTNGFISYKSSNQHYFWNCNAHS